MSRKGKSDFRAFDSLTVDTGTTGKIDTTGDAAVADVRENERITVYVNQETDAGTCTILVESTIDGVNFALEATLTEASFPAGNNTAKAVSLADSTGMSRRALEVRVRATAVAGGGVYSAWVAGQAQGYST